MKKYTLLIGSIAAAILVIFASFTSVVGVQSIEKEDRSVDSPLFAFRTNQILKDKKHKTINNNYLGKDNEINILFTCRDPNIKIFSKVISELIKMDENTYNKYLDLAYARLKESNDLCKENLLQIKSLFEKLRKNNYDLMYQETEPLISPTIQFWMPGCLLYWLFSIFCFTLFILYCIFWDFSSACGPA